MRALAVRAQARRVGGGAHAGLHVHHAALKRVAQGSSLPYLTRAACGLRFIVRQGSMASAHGRTTIAAAT